MALQRRSPRARLGTLCIAAACLALLMPRSAFAQDASTEAVALAVGSPLPLPKDPEAQCYQSAFAKFTAHNPRCARNFWHYQDPDAECCEGIADYFGPNSAKPSRNCWCVPEAWEWMNFHSARHYIEWQNVALMCSRMGYIVPFHHAEGKGYCNGTAPDAAMLEEAHIEHHKRSPQGFKSVSKWLGDLHKDGLVRASLATGIISAIGLSAMLYPILYEVIMAAKESVADVMAGKRRA